jgi:hypothetical protein
LEDVFHVGTQVADLGAAGQGNPAVDDTEDLEGQYLLSWGGIPADLYIYPIKTIVFSGIFILTFASSGDRLRTSG